jgi:hypothetical protein
MLKNKVEFIWKKQYLHYFCYNEKCFYLKKKGKISVIKTIYTDRSSGREVKDFQMQSKLTPKMMRFAGARETCPGNSISCH